MSEPTHRLALRSDGTTIHTHLVIERVHADGRVIIVYEIAAKQVTFEALAGDGLATVTVTLHPDLVDVTLPLDDESRAALERRGPYPGVPSDLAGHDF